MSILSIRQRPAVVFDPDNKEHRKHYAKFLETGTWSTCPVRFEVDNEDSNNNLAYAMQRMLTEYYMQREFKIAVKSG